MKIRVSVSLGEEIFYTFKNLAKSDDRKFSNVINKVLKDYLEKNKVPILKGGVKNGKRTSKGQMV